MLTAAIACALILPTKIVSIMLNIDCKNNAIIVGQAKAKIVFLSLSLSISTMTRKIQTLFISLWIKFIKTKLNSTDMLYLISTPIGNIKDVTLRALDTLKQADIILAEDTRRIRKLLSHYSISLKDKQLTSLNENNIKQKTPFIIKELKNKKIALVSDNGTPTISDPGYYLVKECIEHGFQPISIPGPCALVAGLSVSGLPTDKFLFLGFFPKKPKKKQEIVKQIKNNNLTSILYESPYRIKKTLEFLKKEIPDYNLVITRELTKKFEEVIRGRVKDIEGDFKGELVLLIRKP